MIARTIRLRDFDPLLMLAALGLVTLGAMLIYSGSLTRFGEPDLTDLSHPVSRQALFAAIGLGLAIVFTLFNYRTLGALSAGLYIASLAALVYVLIVGDETYGSRRWIVIGGTQIQPSEIAKLIVIIAIAKYVSDNQETLGELRVFSTSLALAGIPAVLVFLEPDLGSAVIFAAIWLGMVIVAGARWRHIGGLFAVALIAIPFVFLGLVSDYQRDRLELWMEPEADAQGAGLPTLQAEISIGSGGLFGKGLTEGSQTQLDFLRTETTDYIFSVLGEELGFAGALALFGLFLLLLWRALRVAETSADLFGRLFATGFVVFVLVQTFVNVGVNVRLLPVTGIPLPFISQGGSSLITLFVGLGILESILIRHRRLSFRDFYV
ncbi:MAG: rod shape-determining protein RodA [Dehalococcoidia bacterium]